MSRLSPYRLLGAFADDYPEWVQHLKGRSGVYVIRESHGERRVLYVGESHTDRLYQTLTRHVQRWELPEAHSYPRARVEVAVRITAPGDAAELQREYIRNLEPRDNVYETELDDVPF